MAGQAQSGGRSGAQGDQAGPNGGQANGSGPAARPESNDFEKKKIASKSGSGRGQIISVFQTEGESERGDVAVPKNAEFSRAVLDVAREVEDEPLPVEYKSHVTQYYKLLGRGGVSPAGESSGGGESAITDDKE